MGVHGSRATRQKKPEVDRTINKGTSYPPNDLIPIYKVSVGAKIAVTKVLRCVLVADADTCWVPGGPLRGPGFAAFSVQYSAPESASAGNKYRMWFF